MYCPNCAASIEGVKFCRSCGANVGLVPQAMTGRLPEGTEEDCAPGRRRRRNREPSIEGATRSFFTGIGFVLVALAVWRFFPGGSVWWFWMLIPALGAIGSGLGECLSFRSKQQHFILPVGPPRAVTPQPRPPEIQASTPSESSVTEHTTRHL
jgi:hypothetical protein